MKDEVESDSRSEGALDVPAEAQTRFGSIKKALTKYNSRV